MAKLLKTHQSLNLIQLLELNTAKDGYVWSKKKYTVIPEYHPTAVFYNRKLSDDIVKDWEVIKPYIDKERENNE